jgi:hypothetical protein
LKGPASLGIRDFAFVIGDHRFECSKFEASFLSPRVTELLSNDSTICEYEIDISNFEDVTNLDSGSFTEFLSLSRGCKFRVTESNLSFAKCIAKVLGNRELCTKLISIQVGDVSLSLSNVLERLELLKFFECCYSNEIEYLASNFYQLDPNIFQSIDFDDLELILSNNSLQLLDEDSLLNFILNHESTFHSLLRYVRSEYLSVSGINLFLNSISLDDVTSDIWISLCHRLRSSNSISPYPTSRFAGRRFSLDSSAPLNGIISHFTAESGGNVHTTGIIAITASSTIRNQCYQVADHNWNNYWYSNNLAHSMIQFDFKTRRVALTNYTIKSAGHSNNHLLHWSIDGSNDLTSWVTLDQRDTNDLNGNYIVKSYSCSSGESSSPPSFFRYLRLIQTGKNSSNTDHVMIGNLEFFGSVLDH